MSFEELKTDLVHSAFFITHFSFIRNRFRSRGVANGVAAALNYMFGFITKKTYYNLETTLSLPGTALFYSVICGIGLIFTYNVLPETEGRSLEDIELHFADNSKTICNRKIAKQSKISANGSDTAKNAKGMSPSVDVKYGTMSAANDNKAFEHDEADAVGGGSQKV